MMMMMMCICRDMSSDASKASGKRACGDLLQSVLAIRRALHCSSYPLPCHEKGHANSGGTAPSRHWSRPDRRLPTAVHVFAGSTRCRANHQSGTHLRTLWRRQPLLEIAVSRGGPAPGALGRVPPRLPTISFLVQIIQILCSLQDQLVQISKTHSSFDHYCISYKTISHQAAAAPGPEFRRDPMTYFQLCPSSQQILATPLYTYG